MAALLRGICVCRRRDRASSGKVRRQTSSSVRRRSRAVTLEVGSLLRVVIARSLHRSNERRKCREMGSVEVHACSSGQPIFVQDLKTRYYGCGRGAHRQAEPSFPAALLCSQPSRCGCLLLMIVQTLPKHIYVPARTNFSLFNCKNLSI